MTETALTPHEEEERLFDTLLTEADRRLEREQRLLPSRERTYLFRSRRERRAFESAQ